MPVNRHALRAIRERSGLSLSALAALAGVSQPHLSNIERGRRQASPDLVRRLAEALRVPLVALIGEPGPAPERRPGGSRANTPPSPDGGSTQRRSHMNESMLSARQPNPAEGSEGPIGGARALPVQTPGQLVEAPPGPSRRARQVGLGIAGLVTATASLGLAPSALAETYYTGRCTVSTPGFNSTQYYYRTFQAAIVGVIERGTGKYIWDHYDYMYWVDPSLAVGPSSDEVVSFASGYDSGLSNPWASPDNHGTIGNWLHEYNWKGAKSYWGYTKVKFHAAFDIPRTPDPHCDAYTATV